MAIVAFENVSKVYVTGEHSQRALDGVSFTLEEGKFVVILGPSGAGKSTLLNLLGGLDSPSEGRIQGGHAFHYYRTYKGSSSQNRKCPRTIEIISGSRTFLHFERCKPNPLLSRTA